MAGYFQRGYYSHLPQPPRSSFFLGHLADYYADKRESGNDEQPLTVTLREWARKVSYAPVFVIFLVNRNVVATTDPEFVKKVMDSEDNEGSISSFVTVMGERYMGESIFSTLSLKESRPRRELYNPGFRESHVHTLFEPVNVCVNAFLDKLQPLADDGTTVTMKSHLKEAIFKTISLGVFGLDSTQVSVERGGGSLHSLYAYCEEALLKNFETFGWTYQYLHPFSAADYRAGIREFRQIAREHFENKIKRIENGEETEATDIVTKCLQMACSDGSINVDVERLVDNFAAFFTGGRAPMLSALSFAMLLTFTHPEVLERVQAEVDEVLESKSAGINNLDELKKLQYTQQILEETMRLYMPIPQLVRHLAQDEEVGGQTVPQGSTILTLGDVMCHMTKHFDNPDTFDPSRFDPDKPRPNPAVYMNFGVGERGCLGRHFAMMAMKIMLAKFVRNYKMTLPDDYQILMATEIVTQVKGEIPCVLEPRN